MEGVTVKDAVDSPSEQNWVHPVAPDGPYGDRSVKCDDGTRTGAFRDYMNPMS